MEGIGAGTVSTIGAGSAWTAFDSLSVESLAGDSPSAVSDSESSSDAAGVSSFVSRSLT